MESPGDRVEVARVCLDKRRVWGWAGALCVILASGIFGLALVLGFRPGPSDRSILLGLVLIFPLAFVHECLHAATAMVVGKIAWRDICFKVNWKMLAAVCHIKVDMTVKVTRLVAAAPVVLMTPVAVVLFLLYPSDMMVMLTTFTVVGSIADLLMLYELRRFAAHLWVSDHPTEAGFTIYQLP